MKADIRDFNFYQFLLEISNQSLDPLQGNPKFDDLVRGMESVFNKLYRRVQEIGILNTLDLSSDRDFVKYLPNNEKIIQELPNPITAPYKDIILEQLSIYLNTDHFKETVAMMMRLWQERQDSHGELGSDHEYLDDFITEHIIPSFKFFTSNAGDLHKSKGTLILLKRLFETYGQVDENDLTFDGIEEHDNEDLRGRRFRKFTSLREGITLESLLKNYENIQIFQNVNLKITNYIELETHKFVVADGYLFISRKDREDWHIINIVDDVYRLNKYYLVIRQYKTLYVYSDRIDLYDSVTNEFILPEVVSDINIVDVEFVPKVINIQDKFSQYHDNNLYFVELITGESVPNLHYNLKRIRYRPEYDYLTVETIQLNMGITYLDLLYLPDGIYPRVKSIVSVDYIWFDFYDADTTETFEFYPNPLIPSSLEPVKFSYSFIINQETKITDPNNPSGFLYPQGKYVCITRDGYDYDHSDKGFAYTILTNIDDSLISKYIVQERIVNNFFETELNNIIGDDVQVRTVFDLFLPRIKVFMGYDFYEYKGEWDANNIFRRPPSDNPSHGDYWIVSNDGNVEVNGITVWQKGNMITWNGKLGYWEKNNDIENLYVDDNTQSIIDHRLIVVSNKEFLNDTSSIDSPFERKNGLFELQLSSLLLDITDFSKIVWVDTNPIEKFGDNPNVIFTYIDRNSGRYYIYSVHMDGFCREYDRIDMTKVMKNFPELSATPIIYKLEITDKHMIAYVERYEKIVGSKSTAVICEDTNYNMFIGSRSNRMNVFYEADVNLSTRSLQPYFEEYRATENTKTKAFKYLKVGDKFKLEVGGEELTTVLESMNDQPGQYKKSKDVNNYLIEGTTIAADTVIIPVDLITIEDEEVQTFQRTLEIYTPINLDNKWLKAKMDLGLSNQILSDETIVDDFQVNITDYGLKSIKEISKLNLRDLLEISILGDPDNVNCDCNRQRAILYLHDFEPLSLFYDFETKTVSPNIEHFPTCIVANKIGKINDEYSSNEDVCRFDTDWFYYLLDDGNTIPRIIRQRFRVNLFDRIQRVSIVGASEPLVFNWSIYNQIDVWDDNPATASIAEWQTLVSEEIFMPRKINAECNPLGTYYTTTGVIPIDTFVNPWDIYNIEALKVDIVYTCNYIPWIPDFNQYTRLNNNYPVIPVTPEDPLEHEPDTGLKIMLEIWRLNSYMEGYSVTGNIISGITTVPVSINIPEFSYSSDPTLGPEDYVIDVYEYTIGTQRTISGTQLVYDTRASMLSSPPVGRIKIKIESMVEYDSGFKNGDIHINL